MRYTTFDLNRITLLELKREIEQLAVGTLRTLQVLVQTSTIPCTLGVCGLWQAGPNPSVGDRAFVSRSGRIRIRGSVALEESG